MNRLDTPTLERREFCDPFLSLSDEDRAEWLAKLIIFRLALQARDAAGGCA